MQCLKSDDSYCAWPIRDDVCRQTFQPHISVSDVMDEAINSGLPTSGVYTVDPESIMIDNVADVSNL